MQSASLHRALVSSWGDQLVNRVFKISRANCMGKLRQRAMGSQEKQPKRKMN